jgi:hypothetical protein
MRVDYQPRPSTIQWLLAGDPAIRWQTMRDLASFAPEAIAPHEIAQARARVATEGWGAALLGRQSPDGSWPGGQWDLVTLWSLIVLKDLGLDPRSPQARQMIDRVSNGLVFKPLGNRPFLAGETEPCINGRILAIGSCFAEPNHALAQQLLNEQLDDGGWNCEAPKSHCSSFHTTICVLDGLLAYERAAKPTQGTPNPAEGNRVAAVTAARKRAEDYLLARRMFRSLRTGQVTYPTHWHYDVLRGLDYLREAGVQPDHRISEAIREAIEVVLKRRHQNGRWPLNLLHPETIPLQMETEIAHASRWNTLRALRVLRWYSEARA